MNTNILYCQKCKEEVFEDEVEGELLKDDIHINCGGLVEEVCGLCLGSGEITVDEPVYANEPWIVAPIGTRTCPHIIQDRQDADADEAWKERDN